MELKGEIKEIIFQNEINSYTIADMYVDEIDGKEDNIITIVGYLPSNFKESPKVIKGRYPTTVISSNSVPNTAIV